MKSSFEIFLSTQVKSLLGRKRPAPAASTSASASVSQPKMPVLQPQAALVQTTKQEPQDDNNDMLDFSALTETYDGSTEGILNEDKSMDPEYNEDLRDFYDVLADKSVKCKICDKVLKAGWHKFGRHYR